MFIYMILASCFSKYVLSDMLRGVGPFARKCAKFCSQVTYFGPKYVLSNMTFSKEETKNLPMLRWNTRKNRLYLPSVLFEGSISCREKG